MAAFIKGDVVIVPFPYSDLSNAKRRPALIISTLPYNVVILCQITSQAVRDINALTLDNADFESGGLDLLSSIRPNKIFTADAGIISYKAGHLKQEKLFETIEKIVELLKRDS